jgi:hypothetical protein
LEKRKEENEDEKEQEEKESSEDDDDEILEMDLSNRLSDFADTLEKTSFTKYTLMSVIQDLNTLFRGVLIPDEVKEEVDRKFLVTSLNYLAELLGNGCKKSDLPERLLEVIKELNKLAREIA